MASTTWSPGPGSLTDDAEEGPGPRVSWPRLPRLVRAPAPSLSPLARVLGQAGRWRTSPELRPLPALWGWELGLLTREAGATRTPLSPGLVRAHSSIAAAHSAAPSVPTYCAAALGRLGSASWVRGKLLSRQEAAARPSKQGSPRATLGSQLVPCLFPAPLCSPAACHCPPVSQPRPIPPTHSFLPLQTWSLP